jgi:hypothetical protein
MIQLNEPFDCYIIDNFLPDDVAKKLSNDFMEYNSSNWYVYNNPLERKKTNNNWYFFPPTTYNFFTKLCSDQFCNYVKELTNVKNLYPDIGLHGAGWHIQSNNDFLNVHLDYSIHPKLNLQRKFNLIYYLTPEWNTAWGGNLEFWSHDADTNKPKEKKYIVENIFNRCVIFDTTQNSWHGFADPINCPENIHRKSIAMYFLCDTSDNIDLRSRALYAPSKEQQHNEEIIDFIKQRSL